MDSLLSREKARFILCGIFLSIVILSLCLTKWYDHSLEAIRERGTIVMLTRNGPHCYYAYRDIKMGFEYELAKAFADFIGVRLKVEVMNSWNGLIARLVQGKGDFIAAAMAITPQRRRVIDFSHPYMKGQQQVIVRRGNRKIKTPEDLLGKIIVVKEGSSYQERLEELRKKIGRFTIKTKDKPTAELIEMVSKGTIETTVANHHIAMLNRRYYPNIKFAFTLGGPEYLAWGVGRGKDSLRRKINEFFNIIKKSGEYEKIYEKYYAYINLLDRLDLKKYDRAIRTVLPRYESIIKMEAERYGFDWRLITAVIYQESHFNPRATSWTGVKGLMQLTKATANEMGVINRLDPQQSIRGGVRYFRQIYDSFNETERGDRILIALAAYNVGKGHIHDAQEIARKLELDPNRWSSLQKTLPLLKEKRYYKKAKYGYCRGTEAVAFVQNVTSYYDMFRERKVGSDSAQISRQ